MLKDKKITWKVPNATEKFSLIRYQKFTVRHWSRYDSKRFLQFHRATAQFVAEMTRVMADSLFLPYNIQLYHSALQQYVKQLRDNYGASLLQYGLDTGVGKNPTVKHFQSFFAAD